MLATAAPLLPALALAAVLPLATARAQADTMPSTFRLPPATDAEWRCQVLGKGCVCARPKRPTAPTWAIRAVPGWAEWIGAMGALTEQACEIAALARTVADTRYAPPETAFARPAFPDAATIARDYIAARMVYLAAPDTTPDGRAAEVRAIVADKPCTISLMRDAADAPWRVTAFVCPNTMNPTER